MISCMKIISEMSLADFKAWSGGKDTMDDLSYQDLKNLEQHLESLFPDGVITDTELNDFLWFERDMIADLLGYRDYEALVNHDEEDWEEHAKSVIEENFPDADEDMVDDYIDYEFEKETSDEDIIKEFKQYMEDNAEEEDEDEK